jgi:hypothetical protein
MQDHIRLDDLLSRNVGVQWFEGVALVQSICLELVAVGASGEDFPAVSQTYLTGDGHVPFARGSGGGGAVLKAANLLASMLSDDAPVRLRLVVTQATGSDSGFANLAEFSEALAYFARPDSRQILRQLYERAAVASPRQQAAVPSVEKAPAIQAETVPAAATGRSHRAAVVAAAVALVACATVWLVAFGSGGVPVGAVAALKSVTAALSGDASVDPQPEAPKEDSPKGRTGRRTDSVAKGTSQRADTDSHSSASPTAHANPVGLVGRRESRSDDVAVGPVAFVPRSFVTLGLSREPEIVRFTPSGVPIFRDPEPLIVIASSNRDDRADGSSGHIYTREDWDVKPPRSVYPKLPADSERGLQTKGRTVLELIVATNGLVERVALRSAPQDIHEFMLVSAAKAWQFEPATLGGQPVRFRHLVALTPPDKASWLLRTP